MRAAGAHRRLVDVEADAAQALFVKEIDAWGEYVRLAKIET